MYTYVTMKVLVQDRLKPPKGIYVHTSVVARHEFSFHSRKDNPSLCHFSSVFLSRRLIELLGPGEISVTFISSLPFLFSSRRQEGKRAEKPSRHRRRRLRRLFQSYLGRARLDFVIQNHLYGRAYLLLRGYFSTPQQTSYEERPIIAPVILFKPTRSVTRVLFRVLRRARPFRSLRLRLITFARLNDYYVSHAAHGRRIRDA